MATRLVNGRRILMTPAEEFEFEQSRTPRLADAILALKDAIRERRAKAEEAGVTVGQYTIDTSSAFRLRLRELKDLAAGGSPQDQIPMQLRNGRVVRVPPAALNAAAAAVVNHVRDCLNVEADKLDAADTLASVAEVRAFDVESGWPA